MKAIITPQGTYYPVIEDDFVGWRLEQRANDLGAVGQGAPLPHQYIVLCPSHDAEDGQPNVVVYMGETGDPTKDAPAHHYDIGEQIMCDDTVTNTAPLARVARRLKNKLSS
jgi:hypothetical protein